MQALADALVYTIAYIACRDGAARDDDADVGALENVASLLRDATAAERAALSFAADRAAAAEAASPSPRAEVIHAYKTCVFDLLGEP